jgi:hypothetical protein
MKFIDITGWKFGRLTAQWVAGRGTAGPGIGARKFPQIQWLCLCECGGLVTVPVGNLISGNSKSCGCLHRELAAKRLTTHGKAGSAEQSMWLMAKHRAKRKGLPFDLAIEDIAIPERCPMLGILLVRGTDKLHDASPTLDRIRAAKGYVKENIRVISYKANRAKNNLTLEEMKLMVENW